MHWLLSTPETFSLRELIRRCGRRYPPPIRAMASGQQLLRVEGLGTGTVLGVTIEQVPAGLVLRTDSRLSGQETEEVSQKVWRMLRLEEDLAPFVRLASRADALASVKTRGARLLRGTTLFEDVLTSMTVLWDLDGTPDYTITASLVNGLGLPLPANPTLHAYPTPARLRSDSKLLTRLLGEEASARVTAVAIAFEERSSHIEALVRRPLSTAELGSRLTALLPLSATAMGQLMLRIGRYDYVPTDALARARLQRHLGLQEEPTERAVEAFFDSWHPWGGLAYWLWDWGKVAEPKQTATTQTTA